MAQYFKLKSQNPDAILLYRVGDFYETFGEDAVTVSNVLGIVLTARNNGGSDIELAGFPYHSLDLYLPKIVRAGYRVAICEQLEKPSKEKKIVERGVTDVVTPGVTIEDALLDRRSNNYLASVHFTAKGVHGIAFIDISTGDFLVSEGSLETITKLIESFGPAEIIHSRSNGTIIEDKFGEKYYHYGLDEWIYTEDFTKEKLHDKFNVTSLKGFGIEDMIQAQIAAGAALYYLANTKNDRLGHIVSIHRIHSEEFVWLDRFTIRNLELIHSFHETGKSLLDVLDQTSTPMGARLLRKWVLMPLINKVQIEQRHQMVDHFLQQSDLALEMDDHIKSIGDLERIVSKLSMAKVAPRELLQLSKALRFTEAIKTALSQRGEMHLKALADVLQPCSSADEMITSAIHEDPPSMITKGGAIKNGFNEELDEYRNIIKNSKSLLVDLQTREAQKTGITNLKIGYNSVFGYYLEVTNKYKDHDLIPDSWVRKQTLSNAERYITDELKQLEDKILHAEERILDIEIRLYDELLTRLFPFIDTIQQNAKIIAQIDCLISFAKQASRNQYCKPLMNDGLDINIKSGRHPVIEQVLPIDQQYVPNDMHLSNDDLQIMMITGPNMSGKSALLRQTAIIVLMAQIGSFVPASAAEIGIVDKIFTRVGASDNISSGESTFMLEMNETASIMNNISERSLILLDEIGRGTSTYDGISIAWALAEFLHNNKKARPKTLFATHYHELNELAEKYPRIKNYNVSTKEVGNKVIFLRKLVEGGCEHSFGIHVAAMAGMPRTIVDRAVEILHELEKKSIGVDGDQTKKSLKNNVAPQAYQLSIFETVDPALGKLKEEISGLELNAMTPIECMLKLNELKKLIG
ncbi:MAG: DNA mismatch repair protein MutS [Saprospiraceae bacterium]|nr:DNA mismatch repair protein MutS [Saprospiraceae bacterium]